MKNKTSPGKKIENSDVFKDGKKIKEHEIFLAKSLFFHQVWSQQRRRENTVDQKSWASGRLLPSAHK